MDDTRTRLVISAALLFRKKGYHGTGVAEVLAAAKAPKGSLYHHFPNGKPDLAIAAADWATEGMLRIIDDAFKDAPDFATGATTLCHKLAKFFDLSGGWDGCPVSAVLFDGPDNKAFRQHANDMFARWVQAMAAHGVQLGLAPDEAAKRAEALMIGLQGSWVMARARNSSDVLRNLPGLLL